MNWAALYKTLALCLISILIEAVSYTKTGKVWFKQLKKPKYAISLQGWYFVGSIYYLIFGIIGYRLFAVDYDIFSLPVVLLAALMIINGFGNFVIFKWSSTKWFYLSMYPFAVLLLAFIIVLYGIDMLSAGLASIYFLWLIYDLYYGYQLWKLNPLAGPINWRKLGITTLFVIGIGGILLMIAVPVYYYWKDFHHLERSTNPADWGPFGDFFGGILNPVISLLTLIVTIIIALVLRRIDHRNRKEDRAASFEPQLVVEQTNFFTYIGEKYGLKKPVEFSLSSHGFNKISALQLPNTIGLNIYNIGLGPAKNIELKYEISPTEIATAILDSSAFLSPNERIIIIPQAGLVRFEYPLAWNIGPFQILATLNSVRSVTHILNVGVSHQPFIYQLPQYLLELYCCFQYVWMEKMQVDANHLPTFPPFLLSITYRDIGEKTFTKQFKIQFKSLRGGREFVNDIEIEEVPVN